MHKCQWLSLIKEDKLNNKSFHLWIVQLKRPGKDFFRISGCSTQHGPSLDISYYYARTIFIYTLQCDVNRTIEEYYHTKSTILVTRKGEFCPHTFSPSKITFSSRVNKKETSERSRVRRERKKDWRDLFLPLSGDDHDRRQQQ
jgi:hypothetical protein